MDTSKTKQLFSSLIDRPPITDQLLQRPPFRFLLDVIVATISSTGFLKDAFDAQELSASSANDKSTKIALLKKFIDVLNTDGSLDNVKASKIVAGKEPEMTNLASTIAIQAYVPGIRITRANGLFFARDSLSCTFGSHELFSCNLFEFPRFFTQITNSVELLQKFAIDAHAYRTANAQSVAKKERGTRRTRTGTTIAQKSSSRPISGKGSTIEKPRTKRSSSRSVQQRQIDKERDQVPIDGAEVERRDSIDEGHFDEDNQQQRENQGDVGKHKIGTISNTDQEPSGTAKTDDSGIADDLSNENDAGTMVSGMPSEQARLMSSSGRPKTALGRPGTAMARPAPPKLKRKHIAVIEAKNEMKAETSTLITGEREEDSESFITEIDNYFVGDGHHADATKIVSEEHGSLVRKILETKKELEAGIDPLEQTHSLLFGENEQMKWHSEIGNLQQLIQQITQRSQPLARLLDTVQEDIDSMLKEMDDWRAESRRNVAEARKKATVNDSGAASQALMLRLSQLDQEIRDTRAKIAKCRASTMADEQMICSIIASI